MSRPPSDWITLAEAGQILGDANVRFRPETIGRWAPRAASRRSSWVGGGTSGGSRSEPVAAAPARGGRERQPRLFEDL